MGGGAWKAKEAGHQEEQSWEWSAHTHIYTLAPRRACLLRHTSMHAFILAGTTICKYAIMHIHLCTHIKSYMRACLCKHTWLARMLAGIFHTGKLCRHLHLGACPGQGWGKEWRNQANAFPSEFPPPPNTPFFTQVNTGRGGKDDWEAANMEVPRAWRCTRAWGPALPPLPGSQAWLLPILRARALRDPTEHSCGSACSASSFLPALPAPPPSPRSKGRSALPP